METLRKLEEIQQHVEVLRSQGSLDDELQDEDDLAFDNVIAPASPDDLTISDIYDDMD